MSEPEWKPAASTSGLTISSVVPGGSQQTPQFGDDGRSDDGGYSYDDDFGSARPFDPQGSSQQLPSTDSQSGSGSTQQSPSGGPQTRSGGS